MGFVGAFLDWECDGVIPLLLDLEARVEWVDVEGLGAITPLVSW